MLREDDQLGLTEWWIGFSFAAGAGELHAYLIKVWQAQYAQKAE